MRSALSRISLGLQDCLYLGNMNSLRDWGHASDYVEMQWLMLQQETPEDYVIATGKQATVRDFIRKSASQLGITLKFEGEGLDEKGIVESIDENRAEKDIVVKAGDVMVAVDAKYYRPTEVDTLLGDAAKARDKLGWVPRISLDEMIAEMVSNDLKIARKNRLLISRGYDVNQVFE